VKKLKLELDEIEVESFDTANEEERSGTVVGHGSAGTGCHTDDVCCMAGTYGGEFGCDSSGERCLDVSACWGGMC
jgi:hypothetical protein